MSPHATVLVCDDIRFELDWKILIVGLYTSDIGIPFSPFVANLSFLFIVETDIKRPPTKISFEVTLPEQNPVRHDFPVSPIPEMPGRTTFIIRQLVRVPGAVLIPGRIQTRVILNDAEEINAVSNWIVQNPTHLPEAAVQAGTSTDITA